MSLALGRMGLFLGSGRTGGGTPTPTPTPSPTVTLSAAISKAEGNSGANLYTYTVSRSSSAGAVVVPWSFIAGGTSADDFTGGVIPAGGNVNLADGVPSGTFSVSVNGDATVESDEAFTVSITAPAGYAAGASMSATGTISNDDTAGATFTMTQLAERKKNYQRLTETGGGQNNGQGTISVTLSAVTATGPVYARRRSAADGTTITQTPWIAANLSATGAQTVNITGVDVRLGYDYLDLSPDGVTWQNGTVEVGMGGVVAGAGQSLAVRMLGKMPTYTGTNASLGVSIEPNCSVYATYTDTARTVSTPVWTVPADGSIYDSTFVAEYLRLKVAATGFNWSFVGHARGSQSITAFINSGSETTALRANLQAAGGFEEFIWFQGHTDSNSGMSNATYQANLTTLFNDLNTRNAARGASYAKFLASVPNINSSSWGTASQIQTIRNAQIDWAAANNAVTVQMRDLDLVDGVHQSQIGNITIARHFYRASRPRLGLANNDIGPTLNGGARSAGSASVVLSVSMPSGATALVGVGDPTSRFKVFAAGTTTTPLSIASTVIGATSITLTLASAPVDTQALDVYFTYPPDASNAGQTDMIYDNNASDGDGLTTGRQLMPSVAGPVVVAAPGVSDTTAPVLSSPSDNANGSTGASLSITTDEANGTLYWYVSTSATPPSASNLKSGTGAVVSGSQAVSASGVQNSSPSGLTASSAYYAHWLHRDAAGNDSAIASGDGFTTAAAGGGTTKVGPDLIATSPTFATGATGFGQKMTGGYAKSPANADLLNNLTDWTLECWVENVAASGAVQVFCGQSDRGWLGVNAAGRLVGSYRISGTSGYVGTSTNSSAGTNPLLTDGARYHVRLIVNASGASLYLNGTLVATNATAQQVKTATNPFTIRSLGSAGSTPVTAGSVDEVAVWNINTGTTVPTSPYAGNESGLIGLYHLDGDLNAATY